MIDCFSESSLRRVPKGLAKMHDGLGKATGFCAVIIDKSAVFVSKKLMKAVMKVKEFIKDGWKQLLIYIIAWGIIISCCGVMYGFDKVALPLTIGMSCGLGFGMLVGIVTANAFDKKGRYTIWNLAHHLLDQLDPYGTRQIVVAVVVTVILAAAVVFPYAVGALIGIVVGNQLAVMIASGKKMNNEAEDKDTYKEKYFRLRQNFKKLQEDFNKFEIYFVKNKNKIELVDENN